jgi:hypothetical protein
MLAMDAQEIVEGQQLVLCSDPDLVPLLRLSLQAATVLVYPTDKVNSSYSQIGKPGVWIHQSHVGEKTPLHLESCRPWKQIENLGGKGRIHIDRFDRLIHPF